MAGSAILHIPHSSLTIPTAARSEFRITDAELSLELLRMTDWHTNELFDPDDLQVPRLVFPYSRLVCDVERYSDDASEPMSAQGMGAIYELTSDGKPLRDRMSGEVRNAYLERYYFPHHRELEELTDRALDHQQSCLIIDCHSFPSIPLPCNLDQVLERPDICVGTDRFHTPPVLVYEIKNACDKLGITVAVDRPYKGTMVPHKYFRMDQRVKSVMIEVRRGLYFDESNGSKLATFESIRTMIRSLLRVCCETRDWQR